MVPRPGSPYTPISCGLEATRDVSSRNSRTHAVAGAFKGRVGMSEKQSLVPHHIQQILQERQGSHGMCVRPFGSLTIPTHRCPCVSVVLQHQQLARFDSLCCSSFLLVSCLLDCQGRLFHEHADVIFEETSPHFSLIKEVPGRIQTGEWRGKRKGW